jgi:hypothetical protein
MHHDRFVSTSTTGRMQSDHSVVTGQTADPKHAGASLASQATDPMEAVFAVDWDFLTVASVLSGAACVVLAFLPRLPTWLRTFNLLASAASIAYGIYVAAQSSGLHVFSRGLLVAPAITIVYLVKSRNNAAEAAEESAEEPAEDSAEEPQAASRWPEPPMQASVATALDLLGDSAVIDALDSYGRRAIDNLAPWDGEVAQLALLRDAVNESRGAIPHVLLILEELKRLSTTGPYLAIGVWRFTFDELLPHWWHSPAMQSAFIGGLDAILSDPAQSPVGYRLNDFERNFVDRAVPNDSPIRKLYRDPLPAIG